jgi:putative hemolysin
MLNLNLIQEPRQPRLKFTTSLARTGAELEEAQHLRSQVFIEEMGAT